MTDKQIIIDDVDVSVCINRNDFKFALYDCYLNGGCQCKDNPNCYFKQRARKTQECEHWKHQAELGSDTTDRLAKQLEEKEQECEELKDKLNNLQKM